MKHLTLYKYNSIIANNRIKFLWALFLILFLMIVYFMYRSIDLNFLPTSSDEYGYYLDAKYFQLHNSLGAATTVNERYSLIGDSGFHGFVYNVFYGSFFKLFSLFGIIPSIMLVHYLLVASVLLFFTFAKISLENKLLIGIVFTSNFIFIVYLSNSMTEIFHYVFAFYVGYLLFMLYRRRERKYLYSFILLVVFLSFFRQSWIFVLFGLFPLTNSIKDFVKYSLIVLLGLTFVLLDIKLFHAPYPFGFFQKLSVYMQSHSSADSLNMVYEYFLTNIDKFFLSEAYEKSRFVFYYKYLFVSLWLYSIYLNFRTKEKSIISATVIATAVFFALLSLYDSYDWREVRMLASPFIIIVVVLILNQKYIPVLLIILFQLLNMNSIVRYKYVDDWNRDGMNSRIMESRSLLQDFSELKKYIDIFEKREILILMNKRVISMALSPMFYQLPLATNEKRIKYSFIIGNKFDIMNSKCDLFISDKPENIGNMKLLGNNKNYYFYQRIN